MAYQVQLDSYHGPLDLLLYLVKREELDILEISISRLTDQFLDYLYTLQQLDVELAGEFLVTAATLMEIKCRNLIHTELEPGNQSLDLPDPRTELGKQLLEYRQFRDAMQALEKAAEAAGKSFARIDRDRGPKTEKSTQSTIQSVELWDLVSAFARILRETQTSANTSIIRDETPQSTYEALVLERVKTAGKLQFSQLFDPPHTRARLIGLFLATLELAKQNRLIVSQLELYGEIFLEINNNI